MNLQNIPSHSVNIRHQFRATPSTDENIACEETETEIITKVKEIDHIYTDRGKLEARELKPGDNILMLCNGIETHLTLSSVEDAGHRFTKLVMKKAG